MVHDLKLQRGSCNSNNNQYSSNMVGNKDKTKPNRSGKGKADAQVCRCQADDQAQRPSLVSPNQMSHGLLLTV